MPKVLGKDLFAEIVSLPLNQIIRVTFPPAETHRLGLLCMQIKSMENLFQSYLNNTCELAADMNLQKFKDMFSEMMREKEELFLKTTISTLGTRVYSYISSPSHGVFYTLNFHTENLEITRIREQVETVV